MAWSKSADLWIDCFVEWVLYCVGRGIQYSCTKFMVKEKVKFSHGHYHALGLELIPVYRQSARRWHEVNRAINPVVVCHYFFQACGYLLWAPLVHGSIYPIPAYYSFVDPKRMKGWVGLVGWPVARRFTHKSGHPSAAGREQDGKLAGQRPTIYRCATQPTSWYFSRNFPAVSRLCWFSALCYEKCCNHQNREWFLVPGGRWHVCFSRCLWFLFSTRIFILVVKLKVRLQLLEL